MLSFLLANFWWLVLGLIPLAYWYSTRNFQYWKSRGINGPQPIPIVGSFFSLTTPISQLYLDYMRKYGKVFGIFQGQSPVLVVADPAIIKQILVKDFHLFRNRLPFGQEPRPAENMSNLVDAKDEVWKRVRSIVTPMFTTSKLRKMDPQMSFCTQSMLSSFERLASEGKTFVAHDATGKFTMDMIAKCAFATETNASEDNVFVGNAQQMLTFKMIPFLISQVLPVWLYRLLKKLQFSEKAGGFFGALSYHLVTQRKADKDSSKKHTDLLQLMIDAEYDENQVMEKEDQIEAHHAQLDAEEPEQSNYFKSIIGSKYLSMEEIISQSIVFFIAGYETTASTMAFCLFELAINSEIQQQLYLEIQTAKAKDPQLTFETLQKLPFLDAVIAETLRKYPPAITAINRECSVDQYTIPECNVTLQKGDLVLFPVYAIHHCEDFYPNPEQFRPSRFLPENRDQIVPYTYLPFGSGPRNCVGMRFALKELKLGLANLIDRFEILQTEKTPDKLRLGLCSPILKTEPIYLQVKKR